MAEPFLSEIRLMSFAFAPRGWALCNGQYLPINQNQALFSLLGTTFGGNGQTTFQLPNLQGRTPIHAGSGHTLGEQGGAHTHTLSVLEMPQHTHALQGLNVEATTDTPASSQMLGKASVDMYRSYGNGVIHETASVSSVGGSQAHENMQPYLTLSFCIALEGIYPSSN